MKQLFLYVGAVTGTILPFFNIPFILRMRKNQSSRDVSLIWVVGVWICILLMLPQQLVSSDISFKIFGIVNFFAFSAVVGTVFWYRRKS